MNLSLPAATESLARWIVDFYLLATLSLALALVAARWMRQPVRRLALAWTLMIELVLLAVVCAMPGWPRVSLGWLAPPSNSPQPAVEAPTAPVATNTSITSQPAAPPLDAHPKPHDRPNNPPRDIAANDHKPIARRASEPPTVAAVPPPANQAPPIRPLPATIAGLFLLCASLAIAWLAWGAIAASRLCRRAIPAPPALTAELAQLVGSSRPPRLLLSRQIGSAAALGLLRPTIILPAAVAEHESPSSLRAVLAHEWAHIRNHDLWLLALGRSLLPLLFAHPLFWWLRKKIRDDQEAVADAAAARDNRPDYAAELLRWVRRTAGPSPRRISAALGIWERPSQLIRRIAMLLDDSFHVQTRTTRRWRIGTVGAVATVGLVISMLTLQAAPPAASLRPANDAAAMAFNSDGGPVIEVSASYPAANSQVVSDTIAAPIEQQINGVEGMVSIESECNRDGTYIARVRFGPNSDPQSAVGLVKSRVTLAMPVLPDAVRQAGVSVIVDTKIATRQRVAIVLEDREGKGRDALRRWAAAVEKRLVAEGAIVKPEEYPGPDEKQLAGTINREKCAAHGIPLSDVLDAVRAAGPKATADGLKNLTVTSSNGSKLPLSAVVEFREEMGPSAIYRVNMYPAIRISGTPPAGKTANEAVAKWLEIAAATLPNGFAAERLTASHTGRAAFSLGGEQARARSDKKADGDTALANAMPSDVVKAWENAGAKAGRLAINERGRAAEIPTFKFAKWKAGAVAELPRPPIPFALDLSETQVTDVGLKELAGLENLKTLYLARTPVTDAGLTQLVRLKNFQSLDVSRTQITDAGMNELAKVQNLRGVNLARTYVADAGMKAMARLKNLQSLNLQGTRVSDAGLKELAGMASLQTLILQETHITDAGLKEFSGMTNLRTLVLNSTWIRDAGLKELAGLKDLRELDLTSTGITDAGMKELARLDSLETLRIAITDVTGDGLKELAGLKNLHSLDLGGEEVTNAGLKHLAELKNLQSLNLSLCSKVTDEGLQVLAGLKNLQTLELFGDRPLTDAGLRHIAGLNSLRSLDIGMTQVTDSGLLNLAGLTKLQSLNIGTTKITDAGLKELAGLVELQSLSFYDTQVTDVGLKELAGMKKLRTVSLFETQVTDAGLKQLAGLKNLDTVDLTSTKVTDAGVKELQRQLPKCKIAR